jgi:hypothetical protein
VNGKPAANLPANFPLPTVTVPAGDGDVTGKPSAIVAAFTVPGIPEAVFAFYTSNSTLPPRKASSTGAGQSYVGQVQFTDISPPVQ